MHDIGILIVEDNAVIALDLETLLERMGFQVLGTAESGEDALEIADEKRPGLILMDINLSGEMSGIEAAGRIRNFLNVPVIFITAYTDDDTFKKAKETAPYGYLFKPYNEKDLYNTIELALYRHKNEVETKRSYHVEKAINSLLLSSLEDIPLTEHLTRFLDVVFNIPFLRSIRQASVFLLERNSDKLLLKAMRHRDHPLVELCHSIVHKIRQQWEISEVREVSYMKHEKSEESVFCGIYSYYNIPISSRKGSLGVFVVCLDNQYNRDNRDEDFFLALSYTLAGIIERVRADESIKEAMAVAEAANLAKSEFIANMSHEFRTPVNAVIGLTELLLLSTETSEKQRRYLTMIMESATQFTELINDVLDITKLESGVIKAEKTDFPFREIMEEILSPFEIQAQKKYLDFKLHIDSGIPLFLRGDHRFLRHILINLLSNAIKFTECGSICIDVEQKRSKGKNSEIQLLFFVSDTGIGIPEEKIETVFERFTQADGSHSRKYGGTGLGLAIAKKFTELMEGDIEIKSEEGKGTAVFFTATFDAALRETEQHTAKAGSSDCPVGIGEISKIPKSILLVEDMPMNLEIAKEMLQIENHFVETASSGPEALKHLENGDFDLVLMDIQMPGMDGFETTRIIRNSSDSTYKIRNRKIPIIAMTAHAMKGDMEKCIEAGMNGYLSKPISFKKLSSAIHGHIRAEQEENNEVGDLILDREGALMRLAGRENLLFDLYDFFITGVPSNIEALKSAIENDDAVTAEREAHSLKGAAANIGAILMRKAAAETEAAAKSGNLSETRQRYEGLKKELEKVLKEIRIR